MNKPLNKRDQYLYTENDAVGRYGFYCFQNMESGSYYFRFNDFEGNAVLFSQGYLTETGRDNGMLSVLKNAQTPSRYEILKTEATDGTPTYQVVIKAGNHQEVARSKRGYSLFEANRLKDMCLAIGDTAPRHDQREMTLPAPEPFVDEALADQPTAQKTAEEMPSNTVVPSTRQLFHLMFYTDNQTCKIEHVITGEREIIQGVSGEAISNFVLKYLPNEWANDNQEAKCERGAREVAPPTQMVKVEAEQVKATPVVVAAQEKIELQEEPTSKVVVEAQNRGETAPSKPNESVQQLEESLTIAETMEKPIVETTATTETEKEVSAAPIETVIVAQVEKEPFVGVNEFIKEDVEMPKEAPVGEIDFTSIRKVLKEAVVTVKAEQEKNPVEQHILQKESSAIANRQPTGDNVFEAFLNSGQTALEFSGELAATEKVDFADVTGIKEKRTASSTSSGNIVDQFLSGTLEVELEESDHRKKMASLSGSIR